MKVKKGGDDTGCLRTSVIISMSVAFEKSGLKNFIFHSD